MWEMTERPWRGETGKNSLHPTGVRLLHFGANHNLCITNNKFEHEDVHRCLACRSMIDFVMIYVQNSGVKRGAELSNDHHLCYFIPFENHLKLKEERQECRLEIPT